MTLRGALLIAVLLDGRLTHTVRTAYPDGRVRTVREYRAGREQGRHEGWWPDGTRLFLLRYDDGLLKGAGGQAVQCLNLMMGWPEAEGLR